MVVLSWSIVKRDVKTKMNWFQSCSLILIEQKKIATAKPKIHLKINNLSGGS